MVWGLRFYGEDVVSVWDGNLECQHEWTKLDGLDKNWRGGNTNPEISPKQNIKGTTNYSEVPIVPTNICSKCGAWRGQLGLEPHPNDYVRHITQVMREVKRVLKPSGTLWLNMGTTYTSKDIFFVEEEFYEQSQDI